MAMSKRKRMWIALGTLLGLLGIMWVSCMVDHMRRINTIEKFEKAARVITISPEWNTPVNLGPPINTPAWEDSPSISPDGTLLFFSRGGYDVNQQQQGGTANVYYSRKVAGKWSEPVFCDFNLLPYVTSAVKAQNNHTVYFASIRPGGHGRGGDIYFATLLPDGHWTKGENVGPPVNTKYNESEPYVSLDGTKLYFTAERPGGFGGMDNWVSTKVNGKWTDPINLGSPPNSPYDDFQPFVTADGQSLYFSRTDFAHTGEMIDGHRAAILRSDRVGQGWSKPTVVVTDFVGEPSLTADGRYLYFVRITFSGGRALDADIMMAERK